jgi:flagellar protein FlaF
MRRAEGAPPGSAERAAAADLTQKLWINFVEALGSDDNALPLELRARLISIGLWIMRETERIRGDGAASFQGLIAVSETIREALQQA